MIILGICNDETASACLMVHGEIVAAASEERFSRVKMDNSFPQQSIDYCLNHAGLTLADVEVVAYSWYKGFQPRLLAEYVRRAQELADNPESIAILQERIAVEITQDEAKRREYDDWLARNIDRRTTEVLDFHHHEAHAASAAWFSPFDKGVAYTSDGRGDFEATTLWKFDRSAYPALTNLYSSLSTDSFGFFYGRITGLLGYRPMRHEGKITGLAALGDPQPAMDLMRRMIRVENGRVLAGLGDFYRPFFTNYSPETEAEIAKYKKEDVAAAAQLHLENEMCALIDHYLAADDMTDVNVMLAGGVFGNVKVTHRIKSLDRVGDAYVQPQMGDGGLCLGACALAQAEMQHRGRTEHGVKPLKTMYLGPTPGDGHGATLERTTYALSEGAQAFAQALSNNVVIGLMQGRMEFGPRALCNRSIIYRTSDRTINDWLNKRMDRTEFMPFAPVMRAETAPAAIQDYREGDITLDFMTATIDCTEDFAEKCPAVVHVDGTARPQIVTEESNRFIWMALREWEDLSGEMSLVNTSFNAHEEPIVCTFDEGAHGLDTGMIDELWVVEGNEVSRYAKAR